MKNSVNAVPIVPESHTTARRQELMLSLEQANDIINGERQDMYGAPEDSFEIIAKYWNVLLWAKLKERGVDIPDLLDPLAASNMMVLFKQARKLGQKPSRDNYIDSIGYEAIGCDRLMPVGGDD